LVPRDAAYLKALSRYQLLVRNTPNSTEKVMLTASLRHLLDSVIGTYMDYRRESSGVVRATDALAKLEPLVDLPSASLTEVEKVKLINHIKNVKLDLSEKRKSCKQYREQLITLAGEDAVTKLDRSLKPGAPTPRW
jgi:hypothetical protein